MNSPSSPISRRDFVKSGSAVIGGAVTGGIERPGPRRRVRRRHAGSSGRTGPNRGQGLPPGDRLCLLPEKARDPRRRHPHIDAGGSSWA